MKAHDLKSLAGSCVALALATLVPGIASAQAADPPSIDAHATAEVPGAWEIYRFLAYGGNPDSADKTGQTPLIRAALVGNTGTASLLLDHGATLDARTRNGLTALHAAAFGGHAEMVAMLIERGADVNDQANRFAITPLHAAAEENRMAVVHMLLAAGADVTKVEVSGYSAASRAGWREHWEAFGALTKAGAGCQPEELVGTWLYEKCMAFTQ